MRGFSLDERDVEHYMAQEFTATCTDAGIALLGRGRPHPRFYGTYPRKLRRYVLDARRHQCMAQASTLIDIAAGADRRLSRRGLLRPGYAADIVVIDTAEVSDHATAMEPHQYSTGIDVVLDQRRVRGSRQQPDREALSRTCPGRVDEFVRRRMARPGIGSIANPGRRQPRLRGGLLSGGPRMASALRTSADVRSYVFKNWRKLAARTSW